MTDSKRIRPPRQAALGKAQESSDSGSNYNNIPAELKALPQWVCAYADKIPKNPKTGWNASVTNPATWGTYEEAVKAGFPHIGFVFKKGDPYVAIDMDPPCNDEEHANHTKVFNEVVSYTEYSVSGKGLHVITRGTIPHAVKRNHIEIYDCNRYFIMTGDHMKGRPTTIEDCDEVVNAIVEQASDERAVAIEHSEPEKDTDRAVYDRCLSSSNGGRFKELWDGQWNLHYSSQSEADYALINMLAFVSRNNEQTKRLFRTSNLGQRDKAMREDYLDNMIGAIRAEQNPAVDFSKFRIALPQDKTKVIEQPIFPPGLVGEMAQYILDTAVKPIPQVALMGGLGLMAGITARTYNISNTGLNLYLLLIAGTAIGKEGASQGVSRLVKAVRKKLPAIQQYIGPHDYASGQALIRELSTNPCIVSVMGEFGHTLKRICRTDAIGADVMWRKVLLEAYNKSGHDDVLGSMVYSDTGKNTPIVNAPCLTLITESSAASLFEELDEHAIEIGLIPRFILLECDSKRPRTNPNAWVPPSQELTDKLEALTHRCLSMAANGTHCDIDMTNETKIIMERFDRKVDDYINEQEDNTIRQIWSRSYVKALRLAGLVTVGLDFNKPIVQAEIAQWAIDLVHTDAQNMLQRFSEGVGGGDPEQLARLRHVIVNLLQGKQCSIEMKKHGVVSHQFISGRAYKLACFKSDRMGAGNALRRALDGLIDGGEIIKLSAKDTQEQFGTTAKCYLVTKGFQSR